MGFSKKGFCMVIYGLRRPSFVPFIAYKGPAGDLETVHPPCREPLQWDGRHKTRSMVTLAAIFPGHGMPMVVWAGGGEACNA